jgi:hypothetical protein
LKETPQAQRKSAAHCHFYGKTSSAAATSIAANAEAPSDQ